MRISYGISDVCAADLLACSTTSTRRPRRPAVIAHISPAAPAPITTASNASAIASVRPPGRRHSHAGFDRQRSAFAIELELAVLHHALQAHRSEEHTSELQSLMRYSYAGFCLKHNKDRRTSYIY